MASKTVTRSTTQTFDCCAKISFLISILISFFNVLDTWEDKTVMWHSSERVYLCTSEWFSDFQFLTKTMKRGYCVFFEISLKTIRPSCILTGHLIYAKERLSWVRPHLGTKISSKKLSAGRRGWVDERGKKGKASSPILVPLPPPPLHSENLLASETAASLQQQCIPYRWFFTYFYYVLQVPLSSLSNKTLKKKGILCSNVLLANTKFLISPAPVALK